MSSLRNLSLSMNNPGTFKIQLIENLRKFKENS